MIKYLGSKRTLLPEILGVVRSFPHVRTVIDLFSGTSRVGHACKGAGYRVLANDHNRYAETLARCYVEADREDHERDATRILKDFRRLRGSPGYVTETFCVRSRFFHPRNGERIDAVREAIARKGLSPELEAVLLVSLMEAADRVDSTTGVQMAYLKAWAPRALTPLSLRLPDLLPRAAGGKGRACRRDALEAAEALEGDLAYVDPPYNQHSYLGNYHVWESLVTWDKPPVYGVACKREDCRERRSAFNSRPGARAALEAVISKVRAPIVVVSCNDEGFLPKGDVQEILATRGDVRVLAFDRRRYVGAQIGIFNPRGEKVGEVGRLRNTEFLLVATPRTPGRKALHGPRYEASRARRKSRLRRAVAGASEE